VSVTFARALLKHTVRCGVDPADLLRRNRIPPRLLREDGARISVERFADLQVTTMLAMQDEALGYASRRMPLGCWSMMCHAVIGSDSLGQALNRFCRFYQLFEFGSHPRLEVDGDSAQISVVDVERGGVPDPYMCELVLFNVHRFGSWLVQEHLPLQQVRLAYPPVAEVYDYRLMFLGNPVAFEQDRSAMQLSPALLERRVVQNEETLRHFLRHPVLVMLTQNYARSSWTSQVRDIVRRNLAAMPELGAVAAEMEVHPQTLRRRLSAEGTTFKEIKNRVRRDTALYYLGKRGLTIEEIAHRAGFSESSAFIRAFKGWTGVTPYTYRKGL
jgi:AraC-like DNA-binding protein